MISWILRHITCFDYNSINLSVFSVAFFHGKAQTYICVACPWSPCHQYGVHWVPFAVQGEGWVLFWSSPLLSSNPLCWCHRWSVVEFCSARMVTASLQWHCIQQSIRYICTIINVPLSMFTVLLLHFWRSLRCKTMLCYIVYCFMVLSSIKK